MPSILRIRLRGNLRSITETNRLTRAELARFFWITLQPVVIERIAQHLTNQFESAGEMFLIAMTPLALGPVFSGVAMVFMRLGDFLYRIGWVISGLFLFEFPATIFAYSGFAARLTNADEMILVGLSCVAIGCLSWVAGRAVRYVLLRI